MNDYFLLIGGYSIKDEITVCKLHYETGELEYVNAITDFKNTSFLCFSPNYEKVFSVGELEDGGSVHAFDFDVNTGKLTYKEGTISGGAGPCHITTDCTGKWLFVSNYNGGSFSLLPAGGFYKKGYNASTFTFHGKSVLPQQQSSHVHSATLTPDNKHVYVADLGADSIYHYLFDAETGGLKPARGLKTPEGSGPRHMTIHPNGKFAYCMLELSSSVGVYDIQDGNLKPIEYVSSLPEDYTGRKWSAEIHFSPDGKYLYVSNRAHESIAIFSVDSTTGKINLKGFEMVKGKTPRNFTIDPTGKYLIVANQDSDNVLVYTVDKETGLLHFTGIEMHTSRPSCLKLVAIPQ